MLLWEGLVCRAGKRLKQLPDTWSRFFWGSQTKFPPTMLLCNTANEVANCGTEARVRMGGQTEGRAVATH